METHLKKNLTWSNLKYGVVVILTLTALAFVSWSSLAQGAYDIAWWTVNGGGGQSDGGTYSVKGTAGQADADQVMSGRQYSLTGGFWSSTDMATGTDYIYLPLLLK